MNKTVTMKAASILKKTAIKFGVESPMIEINESPMRERRNALYIDGDLVDMYFGYGYFGFDFRNAIDVAFKNAGIFVEPYTTTILDVYNEDEI